MEGKRTVPDYKKMWNELYDWIKETGSCVDGYDDKLDRDTIYAVEAKMVYFNALITMEMFMDDIREERTILETKEEG
jgi:hypothetical protein